MSTLEEFRRWLRGKRVEGFPENRAKRPPIVDHQYETNQFKINADGDDALLRFGEHRGETISQLVKTNRGRSYLRWIIKSDFPEELKSVCRYQLRSRRRG